MSTGNFMSIDSLISSQTTTTSSNSGSSNLGKDEFLRLLTLQLSNQDPLDPMKNEDYIAQLAQFSSLEQLQTINDNIQTQSLLIQSLNNGYATSLIDKKVRIAADDTIYKGETLEISPRNTANISVEVYDSSGKKVAEKDLGLQSKSVQWTWDGGDEGAEYTYKVISKDTTGTVVDTTESLMAKVTGVKFSASGVMLMLSGRSIPISGVTEVYG